LLSRGEIFEEVAFEVDGWGQAGDGDDMELDEAGVRDGDEMGTQGEEKNQITKKKKLTNTEGASHSPHREI
jgi:hypothetical protein